MERKSILTLQKNLKENFSTEIELPWGLINVPERVLQEIWHEQNFIKTDLKTHSQKTLKILHPGTWNFSEGPDFKNALIEIDNKKKVCDIEIHFYSKDWFKHRHHLDPNFNNTLLQVTLFHPLEKEETILTFNQKFIETLPLLERLTQSLEECMFEKAIKSFPEHTLETPQAILPFKHKTLQEILTQIQSLAQERWLRKKAFAKHRLKNTAFDQTCHQVTLEILGAKKNRVPMAEIALEYPLQIMKQLALTPKTLFDSKINRWKLNGIRPANHPQKRIKQYLSFLKHSSNWPYEWLSFAESLPIHKTTCLDTNSYRKKYNLSTIHKHIKTELFKNVFSDSRLNTLFIDSLLPLGSVFLRKDFFPLWYHWYIGDMPKRINQFIKNLNFLHKKKVTLSNGLGQGLLSYNFNSE